MKWFRKREKLPIPVSVKLSGNARDLYSAIPVQITHTVEHKPFPKPHTMTITLIALDGREWRMPPMFIRNGAMHSNNFPRQLAQDMPWVGYRMEFFYGE